MTVFWTPRAWVASALTLLACGRSAHSASFPPPTEAQAVIDPEWARFVFPRDTIDDYFKHYPGSSWIWSVNWWPQRMGQVPHAIWAQVRYPAAPCKGDLAALLRDAETAVMTSVDEVDLPISRADYDTAVVSLVQDGRWVIAIRTRGAVRRIFPERPDSVMLSWGSAGGQRELWVPVEHRDP